VHKPVVIRKAINRSRRTYDDGKRWLLPYKYPGVQLTPARLLNYWHGRIEKSRGVEKVRAYPTVLTIEATNVCNLRCPACFTGASQAGRDKSMLQASMFERVLDELGSRLLQIEFYNWGEPLLNKELCPMIRKAADRGISTIISSNMSVPMDDARAEEIVASGLNILGVSVDGATQEVYEQYRVRGNLELLFENVRKVTAAKRRLGSKTPQVVYEYHLFKHNLHEVEEARRIAKELEMDLMISKGWVAGPDWDEPGEFNRKFDPQPGRCGFLWDHAVIHNDGGVAACCAVFYKEDDYGTINGSRSNGAQAPSPAPSGEPSVPMSELHQKRFHDVWNNDRFRTSRRMFANRPNEPRNTDLICYDCPVTDLWRKQRAHVASGGNGTVTTELAYNDGFNYFFNRRPARATNEGLIPLAEVKEKTPV
jgi:MoaA/NifB/PqqE/SkfB family radical SAM enzyme